MGLPPQEERKRRAEYIENLDETMLLGGVELSEFSNRIISDCDVAYIAGADLAVLFLAVAAIESHFRFEGYIGANESLAASISSAPIEEDVKDEIHRLRTLRNRWVHVKKPRDDGDLQINPRPINRELSEMAGLAIHTLRRVIYDNQWV